VNNLSVFVFFHVRLGNHPVMHSDSEQLTDVVTCISFFVYFSLAAFIIAGIVKYFFCSLILL